MAAEQKTVVLEVYNKPGVLGRVSEQIRREGWNIRHLVVGEDADKPGLSRLEMELEGHTTKLALVLERMLSMDCVCRAGFDGEALVAAPAPPQTEAAAEAENNIPEKAAGSYRVLVINPGSTSTKFAVFDNEECLFTKTVRHTGEELAACGSILGQQELRLQAIMTKLTAVELIPETLDAVAGRGGLVKPIDSGTYAINERMLADLRSASATVHASCLGAILAHIIAAKLSIPAFVVDPIVVDEMERTAKLTGMPGVERITTFHALNHKAIAKRLAAQIGRSYENCRFIVAHLGGGITVGAHKYGRVVDVNDALSGEGPFTPERTGAIPLLPLVEMCFSGEYTKAEILRIITGEGGMKAYLGTNDLRTAQKMINDGDAFAALVVDSMAYQVAKEIGSMAAVLEGRVDAILLTGGLAYSNRFTGQIKQRVDAMAPVYVLPGEDELLALLQGTLRVLRGEEEAAVYV